MHNNNNNSGLGLEISGLSEITMNRLPEPTEDVEFDEPDEIFETLEDLLSRGAAVEDRINLWFEGDEDVDPHRLAGRTKAALEEALTLLGRLRGHSEHPLGEEHAFDDVRYSVDMAISELGRQLDAIEHVRLAAADPKRTLTAVGKAKGVTTKALVNVEQNLCEDTELHPRLGSFLSLEDSLETRRAYGKMRRALFSFPKTENVPEHEQVVTRLRRAGTSFVHLRGHHCFEMLRVEDRFQFEELWERVYDWLQSNDGADDTYAGWLIWKDVINFIELLGSINFRQDLREHDTQLAREARDELSALQDEAPVGDSLADKLHRLTGFSPAVDALIEQGEEAPAGDWRAVLDKIERGL